MPFAGPTHYLRAGHGRPVVLLHGLGGDVGFWGSELETLSDAFDVIAIDLRGSGATPSSPDGHTIDDLADDVAAVLDELGLPSASVVGFSMGGLVAQAFAVRHAARLDRLVLASTYAVMGGQARLFLDAVLDVYENGAGDRRMFELICPWLFSPAFVDDPANADYLVFPPEAEGDQPLDDWRKLYLAQRAFDGRAALGSIAAETLVIHGSADALVPAADVALLAAGIPGARLRTVDGAGHLFAFEAPEVWLRELRGFLGA